VTSPTKNWLKWSYQLKKFQTHPLSTSSQQIPIHSQRPLLLKAQLYLMAIVLDWIGGQHHQVVINIRVANIFWDAEDNCTFTLAQEKATNCTSSNISSAKACWRFGETFHHPHTPTPSCFPCMSHSACGLELRAWHFLVEHSQNNSRTWCRLFTPNLESLPSFGDELLSSEHSREN